MTTKKIDIKTAITNLIPKLQQQITPIIQKQTETRRQLENNLRALLQNSALKESITRAQLRTLQKAADICKNQGPGIGTKMVSGLWQKVIEILDSFMKGQNKTDEDEGRITEINRIIYNSLIHPTRNDLTNMDIFITRKGFGWKDDFDSIDNQLALLKLSSSSEHKLHRKLANVHKQRITHKKRDDESITEQQKKENETKKEQKSQEEI